jgi:hypothetical protein
MRMEERETSLNSWGEALKIWVHDDDDDDDNDDGGGGDISDSGNSVSVTTAIFPFIV